MILSVSRRTDIPAFYSDWFFEQLDQGFVLVPNPIVQEKIAKITFEPLKIENIETNLLGEKKVETSGNIEGIVFWTKNPKPMLEKLDKLSDFKYYFLYTLNAYPKKIEFLSNNKKLLILESCLVSGIIFIIINKNSSDY